eukprot:SAG11_NODE_1389_length_5057_cov_16.280355_3_plen_107_part_00
MLELPYFSGWHAFERFFFYIYFLNLEIKRCIAQSLFGFPKRPFSKGFYPYHLSRILLGYRARFSVFIYAMIGQYVDPTSRFYLTVEWLPYVSVSAVDHESHLFTTY